MSKNNDYDAHIFFNVIGSQKDVYKKLFDSTMAIDFYYAQTTLKKKQKILETRVCVLDKILIKYFQETNRQELGEYFLKNIRINNQFSYQ